jgi:hypothetical protein
MLHDDPVKVLLDAGYRHLSEPIRIEGVTFRFDDALVGPGDERDLVLVERQKRVPASLARLARALIAALESRNSTRPVSLVVVSDDPEVGKSRQYEDIRRICPVYVIGPGADVLRALRPLMPLVLQAHSPETRSAEAVLARKLGALAATPLAKSVLAAARESSVNVERVMLEIVEQAASPQLEDA